MCDYVLLLNVYSLKKILELEMQIIIITIIIIIKSNKNAVSIFSPLECMSGCFIYICSCCSGLVEMFDGTQ